MALPAQNAPASGGTNIGKTAFQLAGLGLGIWGVIELAAWYKKKKEQDDLKRDQASTIKPGKNGKLFDLNGKPITGMNLATIATDLDNALSFPADQDRAVRVFQSTPFGYVDKLEQLFTEKGYGNLRQRLVDKLSDERWIKIKFNFR